MILKTKKYHACFLFKQTFWRVKKLSITILPFVCHNQNNSGLSLYVTGKIIWGHFEFSKQGPCTIVTK